MPAVIKITNCTQSRLVVKTTRTRLHSLLKVLHSHILVQYKSLVDIAVYDNPTQKYRFTVMYNLLSTVFNARLLVCSYTDQIQPLPSVCCLYTSAN